MDKIYSKIVEEERKTSAKEVEHKTIENVKLHHSFGKDDCRLQNHGPFLFVEDLSERYASNCENRTIYHCACLECGRQMDYQMSPSRRRMVVYTTADADQVLSTFYIIRKRYIELQAIMGEKENIVKVINQECQENSVNIEKQYTKKII